jgi:hypothetical protein
MFCQFHTVRKVFIRYAKTHDNKGFHHLPHIHDNKNIPEMPQIHDNKKFLFSDE